MAQGTTVYEGLNLVARDLDATLAFYRRLGVEVPEDGVWRTDTGAHHANGTLPGGGEIEFGSETLAPHWNKGWTPAAGGSRVVIGFRVESRDAVDRLCKELAAEGVPVAQEPWDAFWGARYAVVVDPDGNHVAIMSPSDPERRNRPPSL